MAEADGVEQMRSRYYSAYIGRNICIMCLQMLLHQIQYLIKNESASQELLTFRAYMFSETVSSKWPSRAVMSKNATG
jgi:hypothetical protein